MEVNYRQCKTCKKVKRRINDGVYPKKNTKRFRDEFGQLWNGNVCGPCNTERLKDHMKTKRAAKCTS